MRRFGGSHAGWFRHDHDPSSWCGPHPALPPLAGEGSGGVRFDKAWTTRIRPPLLVLLGTLSASIFQFLVALVNSISKSCPFGKRAFAPFFRNGAIISNKSGSGANARAVT